MVEKMRNWDHITVNLPVLLDGFFRLVGRSIFFYRLTRRHWHGQRDSCIMDAGALRRLAGAAGSCAPAARGLSGCCIGSGGLTGSSQQQQPVFQVNPCYISKQILLHIYVTT